MIRLLTMDDYEDICRLWMNTTGLGLNELDDSKEGIGRFLHRNPTSNFVAIEDDQIVGTILSGHDGRRGQIYHTCVNEAYRRRGIGEALVRQVISTLREEHITKVSLIALRNNSLGNDFWSSLGWLKRDDMNLYTYSLVDRK